MGSLLSITSTRHGGTFGTRYVRLVSGVVAMPRMAAPPPWDPRRQPPPGPPPMRLAVHGRPSSVVTAQQLRWATADGRTIIFWRTSSVTLVWRRCILTRFSDLVSSRHAAYYSNPPMRVASARARRRPSASSSAGPSTELGDQTKGGAGGSPAPLIRYCQSCQHPSPPCVPARRLVQGQA